MREPWSAQTKLVVSLLLLALFVYFIFRFSNLLIPLSLAVILAFILSPLANAIQERLHIRRILATFLCYLLLLAILVTLPIGVIPLLTSQVSDLNLDVQLFLQRVESLLDHQYIIAGQIFDGAALFRQAVLFLQDLFEPVFSRTLEFAIDLISSFVWIVFVIVVSFYLVKDGPTVRTWIENLVPPTYRQDFILLREEINAVWSSFFRGQLLLALVVSIIFLTAGMILGLPFVLIMSILAGLLEFLPSIGHGIWLMIASILAFFVGSTWLPIPNWVFMLILIALHTFFTQFDLNYLIPRIIGRSVRLPPLVVILGIVAGAVFAGVMGILLAAPTIASGRVIARYIFANLFDLDPFPESIVATLPPPNPRWWRPDVMKNSMSRSKEG